MTIAPRLYLTQGSGNSIKPMLVASQLGIDCHIEYLDVLSGETQQPAFLAINPLGAVPYLVLPDGTGLGESNAIAWYLAEGTTLMPDTALTRAQAVRWMNFEQTALEANISPRRFFTAIAPELGKDHQHMLPVWQERGDAALAVLDNYLDGRDFVTDYGYSVADIAVFGYTHLADEGGFRLADYPHVRAWIERVTVQPGYQNIGVLLNGNDIDLAA
ncbi:MAG: glutathione S-transferase family protein [Pseudomonadota bacterium]